MEDNENETDPNELRLMGNHNFSQGKINEAFQLYDLAVEILRSGPTEQPDELAIHLCNRSACSLRMGELESAKEDAIEAISLSQGKNAKAFFRLAKSQIALEQYAEATETIQKALENYSTNEYQTTLADDGEINEKSKQERSEFQKLLVQIHKRKQKIHESKDEQPIAPTTLKSITCPAPSIRDFKKSKILGEGNFSKVVMCKHNTTGETFALKIINKDEAKRLAKRQHPNVYNEIQMERKLLCEKLNSTKTTHQNIVRCWHAFQDYENLYFLMDFCEGGDLWSRLFYGKKMVGCHFSLIPHYAHQILSGIEHLHSHGIVHRDLKPENILMDGKGHPIIIDLGTAKDLLDTELNGPEFVGTPDFMTPEAVNGNESSFEADLWTFGAILFQMFTGQTPFQSVSPYMTFLRIKRAKLKRKMGIVNDSAWDLIVKLMQLQPQKRIGSGSFVIEELNGKKKVNKKTQNGYEQIRNHPYFLHIEQKSKSPQFCYETLPTEVDVCMRKCADLVHADSKNLEISDPGDNSSHDVLRLPESHRNRIMHILDRMHLLHDPRVFRRFFKTRQEARLGKIRPASNDYIGLTIEDFPLEEQQQQMDEGIKVVIRFVFLMNPLFTGRGVENEEEKNLKHLKECIRNINKLRPKAVIVCGSACAHQTKVRKLLSKVNESIHVVINDGQHFFSIWLSRSVQAVVINQEKIDAKNEEHKQWLDEELEQYRIARNTTFAFCDSDPSQFEDQLKRKLARAKISCVYGINCGIAPFSEEKFVFDSKKSIEKSEDENKVESAENSDYSDNDEEDIIHKMTLFSGHKSMHLISVTEESGDIESKSIDI